MTTYLVTGATRGIGKELVRQLSLNRDNVVIAGVRDPSALAAKKVANLSSKIILVKLDANVDDDPKNAVKKLQTQGIDHVDVVVANAGIATDWNNVVDVNLDEFRDTLNVNVLGPLNLFQAFLPLLEKSTNPKFIVVSTAIASMGYQRNLPYKATTYGASKAAINFVSLRIAIEHPNLVSVTLHPGLVQTDMAGSAQTSIGQTIEAALAEGSAITTEQSAKGIIKLAQEATVDSHSGKFFNATDGSELPW